MSRRVRDPQSREQLVEAAWRLVALHGPAATTLRAVAAEAGVTTGAVTHYFEDKAELMAAVLRHNSAIATERVLAAIEGRRGLAAAERATLALLPLDEVRFRCWQVWLAFWSQAPGQVRGGSFLEGYREWADHVARHLAEAIEDGELPEGLDLRYEINVLGTLVAGTGLLAGSDEAGRSQMQRRARRIFGEHFAALKGKSTLPGV
ncbi:TetR/AcrR family transcriptional regulator [Amycolatopsis rhizosphaerae]|uniref:TetR/AcrR family transcriptional regulator n=1 Tax=Amycolatopsis rhizosphaerae TaxID=2053003 RepID=A0A558A4Q4_9PSEU|nr:TetR family transcriptional regulator [Amycolatopsis rhizosphaerae]TVT19226.1 TetR/AcrR family transcriptional regulator [Amycolatopsis rhizosphaerae]